MLLGCGATAVRPDEPTSEQAPEQHVVRAPSVGLVLAAAGDVRELVDRARNQLLARGIEPLGVRAEGDRIVVDVAPELADAAEATFGPAPEFFIAEVDEQWSPADLRLPSFVRVDERTSWGGSPTQLRTAVAPPQDHARLVAELATRAPPGRRFVVGKNLLPPGTPDGAHGVLAFEEPIVTGADIREVELREEGVTVVYVTFHDEAAAALRQATTPRTGFRIALVLDGRVIMAPVITAPIDAGQARLDPGDGQHLSAVQLADDLRRSAEGPALRVIERRQP